MSRGTNTQSNGMGQPINADNRDDLSLLDITASLNIDNKMVDETFSVSST
jgi:hypothetical protein